MSNKYFFISPQEGKIWILDYHYMHIFLGVWRACSVYRRLVILFPVSTWGPIGAVTPVWRVLNTLFYSPQVTTHTCTDIHTYSHTWTDEQANTLQEKLNWKNLGYCRPKQKLFKVSIASNDCPASWCVFLCVFLCVCSSTMRGKKQNKTQNVLTSKPDAIYIGGTCVDQMASVTQNAHIWSMVNKIKQ